MSTGIIFDIIRGSFVDGPGIRTAVFFKGCNLDCKWCHNPEGKAHHTQMMFYENKCMGCGKCSQACPVALKTNDCTACGSCADVCPTLARVMCGKKYNVHEVMEQILKDKKFYDVSGGGVTFSGGECMLQIDFLSELLTECKREGINIAVDTAGNVGWDHFEKILPNTDVFLYDLKCMDNRKHLKYVGAENVLILDNLKKLLSIHKQIIVRVPVIPGVNDDDSNMQLIKGFFEDNRYPDKIEFLPYHSGGNSKAVALGNTCHTFDTVDRKRIEDFNKIFNKKGEQQ